MSTQTLETEAFQNINTLAENIGQRNPLQAGFVKGSIDALTDEEVASFSSYLDYCRDSGHSVDYLAECYDVIVKDTLREQIYFQRHGKYRHSSYDEVAGSVYMDPAYMEKYMVGLALTSFLWPNHRQMRHLFYDSIPADKSGDYLEIGPGHGFYFMAAMSRTSYDSFTGVDISPKSVEMTKHILESGKFGTFSNYQILCQDFLTSPVPSNGYAAIVMGEVLEHVENPLAFLQKIHQLAADDAYIYVTTAINAPAVDHIWLYDSVKSVVDQTVEAGFKVVRELVVPYTGKTVEESEAQKLPINIALVLAKV